MERMINTVPSTVNLTDVIDPIPVKVGDVQLGVGTTALTLNATLRVSAIVFFDQPLSSHISHSSGTLLKTQNARSLCYGRAEMDQLALERSAPPLSLLQQM